MGLYRQYRSLIRQKRYMNRLVERAFCLDANFLTRQGFFRGGREKGWEYACKTEWNGEIWHVLCTLIDTEYPDEHGIQLKNISFFPKRGLVIRASYQSHPLVRWRNYMYCPKCKHRVCTLFIPWHGSELACRECHRLVYWNQMRGKRRIGKEAYERSKPLYKVHKTLTQLDNYVEL